MIQMIAINVFVGWLQVVTATTKVYLSGGNIVESPVPDRYIVEKLVM